MRLGIYLLIFLSITTNLRADADGKPVIQPVSCGTSLFSAAEKLCNLFETFGGAELCKLTADTCVEGTQQVFTGNQIELATPTNIKKWTGFGGLGLSYLGANLCMLRDLKDADIYAKASAITPLGKVTLNQNVSFYKFDKNIYEWTGYHTAKACVPVFGCLDIFNQKITAKAVNTPMTNSDHKAGEYAIHSAHAMDIKTEGIVQSLKVTIPAIEVKTPYGQVSAKPEFKFGRAVGHVLAPYNKNNAKSTINGLWKDAKVLDLYGVNPGTKMSGVYPYFHVTGSQTLDNRRIGYISQIAFGGRDANPKNAIWAPSTNIEFPMRPDFDFKKARSIIEKTPNAYISADVHVEYSPTDLLPAAIRNNGLINIDFSVFAKPMIDAGLSSQFNIVNSEIAVGKKLAATNGPLDYRPMFMEQYKNTSMSSGVSAAGRFSLTAGVDLKLHLFVPLPWPLSNIDINLIDIHPRTTVLEVIDVGHGTGNRSASASSQSPQILASGKLFQTYKSFNGFNGNGQDHIKACLAAPSVTGKLPREPEYTPGNAEDLTKNILYPCNICVAMDTYEYKDQNNKVHKIDGFLNVMFPVTQNNMPAQDRWVCDKVYESGCHDMCSYYPETNQLKVVETAKKMRRDGKVTAGPPRCN